VTFGALNYTILAVYMAVMAGVGLLFAGRQKTTESYFLAGRNMPWLVVAMSMFASLTSAITYMSVPGTAYKQNVSLILSAMMSPVVAPVLIVTFYPFYRLLRVTTSYEYILSRYGPRARLMVSTLFVLLRLGWLGTVIYAPALALMTVTGIDLYVAILFMGVLATAYTVLGGLSAVLWTDVLQFVILVGGAIWVAVSLTVAVPGGARAIVDLARRTDHMHVMDWQFDLYQMTGIIVAISYFLQLLHDYGADQVTVQRLLAVKTFRGMAKATLFNGFADLIIMSLLLYVGIGIFAYFHSFPAELAEGLKSDQMLPYYIMHALPNGVSGLVITGIFAAAMSSMDSGINSVGTVLINDFVRPLRKQPRSDEEDVRLARYLTLGLGVLATLVALLLSNIALGEQILKASSFFLGMFGAPILALFVLGMFTRRANFPGWFVSVVVAVPAALWLHHGTEVHWIYYFPFGFTISSVIAYPASVVLAKTFGLSLAEKRFTIWGRGQLASREDP
jgi:SSS family solute:Na+ symporter